MDIPSTVSGIRIADRGGIRTLYFRKDDGRQAIESQVDMGQPHKLRLRYTRSMFASYLFVPDPEHVLLIGLGGGAMVRFLAHYHPELRVDAVDIDPAVVTLAAEHFGTQPSEQVRLIAADGLAHLQATLPGHYDVVYIDAYLGSRDTTDRTGVPLHLKSAAFHAQLRRTLRPGGVAVFNLHMEHGLEDELAPLRVAFSSVHHFIVPRSRNHVIIVSGGAIPADPSSLQAAAARAEPRFQGEFSVAAFVADLRESGAEAPS